MRQQPHRRVRVQAIFSGLGVANTRFATLPAIPQTPPQRRPPGETSLHLVSWLDWRYGGLFLGLVVVWVVAGIVGAAFNANPIRPVDSPCLGDCWAIAAERRQIAATVKTKDRTTPGRRRGKDVN
jgi:hypothetical protein